MCSYTPGHDRAYVCIHVWAWLHLCVHTRVGMMSIHTCTWSRLCMHARLSIISPMYAYTRAWLLVSGNILVDTIVTMWLCVHTWLGMITPMCAGVCGHDCALSNEYEKFSILHVCYMCMHNRAYVCIHAWAWHIRVGMMVPMCSYACRHDCTYVCMYIREWLCACVHTRMGMFAPMCAYTCRKDCSYVARWLVGI